MTRVPDFIMFYNQLQFTYEIEGCKIMMAQPRRNFRLKLRVNARDQYWSRLGVLTGDRPFLKTRQALR